MKVEMLTGAAVAALGFSALAATDLRELTFQVAVPTEKPPVIDGSMDDACWQKAPAHTAYYQYYVANPPCTNGYADCRLVYDEKGLYMAVRNPEPLTHRVKAKHLKNFDGDIWYDESAEIYFDPAAAGMGWYKVMVNSSGAYDTSYRMDPANLDDNWVGKGIVSAAKVFDDRWEFELFLPWSMFDGHPPVKPGEMWTFLHCRFRWLEHPWKDFFASSSGCTGGYTPNRFGYLYFSDGNVPKAEQVLDILSKQLDCRWAVQIGKNTYMHDEKGVHPMSESIHSFIARHEAEDKKINNQCLTNIVRLINEPDFVGEPVAMPLAGTYDLNPPKDGGDHCGWYRHNIIRGAYVTPHLEWAPKALGKSAPRVVALTGMDTSVREMVEMDQRFAFDELFVHPGGFGASGVFEDPVSLGTAFDKARQIETLLAKNPDVIVFCRYPLKDVPPRYRYEILRRVRDEGVGLVILGHGLDFHEWLPKNVLMRDGAAEKTLAARAPIGDLKVECRPHPWHCRNCTLSDAMIRAGRFGKGRVALAAFAWPPVWTLEWKAIYECRTVWAYNAIRWAQGVDPVSTVDYGFGPSTPTIGPKPSFVAFSVKAEGVNAVRYRIRDMGGRVFCEKTAELKAGDNTISADASNLPSGDYVLDVMPCRVPSGGEKFLSWFGGDDATAYDFASFRTFSVASPLGKVTVAGTNDFFVAENAAPNVPIEWEQPIDGGTLEWTLSDLPYRQVRQQGLVYLGRSCRGATVARKAGPFPTRAGVVRGVVRDRMGRVLSAGEKIVYFPNHRYPDYTTIMWAGPESGRMAEFFMPQIREWMGYDGYVEGSAREASHFNAWCVPSVHSLRVMGNKKGSYWYGWVIPQLSSTQEERDEYNRLKKDYNIHRPDVAAHIAEAVRRGYGWTAKWVPLVCGLGDESHYCGDLGLGDAQDDGYYRAWLEKRYGTIQRFNAAHKTNLTSFAQATHYTSDEALKAGNYPAWFDTQTYSAHYYADCGELQRAVLKKMDPKLRIGHEASGGGDLEYTLDMMDFWGPYRDVCSDEMASMLLRPDVVRAVWWGGYVNESRNGFPTAQWEFILTGTLNGDEWFCGYPAATAGCFGGDLAPAPYVVEQWPHHIQLRRGLAQLMMHTPLRKSPFVHVCNRASGAISNIDEKYGRGDTLQFIRFCYHYGYGVTLVPPARPKLMDGAKIAFVSGCCSLDDTEVANLEALLKRGGTIVSDAEPGVLDGYLAKRDKAPFAGRWTKIATEWKDAEMQAILDKAGIRPKESVTGLDPKYTILRCRDCEYKDAAEKTFGKTMSLVGFKTLAGEVGKKCAVDFAREAYVYETDAGYVGKVSRLDIAKLEKPFKLYSLFEKEQAAPAFALSTNVVSAGAYVTYDLAGLRPNSVYRLTVKEPVDAAGCRAVDAASRRVNERPTASLCSGEATRRDAASTVGGNGEATRRDAASTVGCEIANREEVFCFDGVEKKRTFQFPFSDRPGVYVVTLRDIATGLETSVPVRVK